MVLAAPVHDESGRTVAALRVEASMEVLFRRRVTFAPRLGAAAALQDRGRRPPQPAWRVMMAAVADFVLDCSHLTSLENGHFTINSGPRALASPWFAWNLCA